MSQHAHLRRAFVACHLTLGLTLLVLSLSAVAGAGRTDRHVLVLGSLEAIGAILFLLPRYTRVGAGLLLATLSAAIAIHAARGQFPGALLVYAAGVAFVAVHGSAYGIRPSTPSAA
jgi:hypothetical protein